MLAAQLPASTVSKGSWAVRQKNCLQNKHENISYRNFLR